MAAEGAAPVASNPVVSIPSTGAGLVTAGRPGAGQVALSLPAGGAADRIAGTTVFAGAASGTSVAVQPTARGLRALVHLDDAGAPERYPFTLLGDVVRLQQELDGGVSAYDIRGRRVTRVPPSWARDASGRDVPTHYEIAGTTIVLVVQHRGGDWAYGITADPLLDDIVNTVSSAGKTLFDKARSLAKTLAIPVCAARGIISAYNKIKDSGRSGVTPEGTKFVRRTLTRELVGCVPEAGPYVQDLFDLLDGGG